MRRIQSPSPSSETSADAGFSLIHDLDVRRFVAKSAQLSFAEYTTHLSNMQSVANLDEITKGLDEASKKRVIENSAKQAAKDAKVCFAKSVL